jgi:hypothetical protein
MGGDSGERSKHYRDAIQLCPSHQTLPTVLIPEGLAIDFGRNLYPSIHQSYVSRHHCHMYWKADLVLRVTAGKRAMAIVTAGGEVKVLQPSGVPGEV